MRKIRFRGKRADSGEWMYGDLIRRYGMTGIYQPSGTIPIIPETVGQFTGMKDRFGVDVYEGDILAVKDFYGNIKAKSVCTYSHGCFWLQNDEQRIILYRDLDFGEMQIIGNVHDNPEFIKSCL